MIDIALLPWEVMVYVLSFDNRFVAHPKTLQIRFVQKLAKREIVWKPSIVYRLPEESYVILPIIRQRRYFDTEEQRYFGFTKEIYITCCHKTGDKKYDLVMYDAKGHIDSQPLLEMYM
jgi:hypothetical protein